MWRSLVAALAVAFASSAAANPVEAVMSVISDICLSHGGDADAVQSLAAERGWPALSDEEIAGIPWLNERPAFLAAWWVSGGDQPIRRARALSLQEQDALAEEMEAWLNAPSPPDDFGADGSDEELAERVRAWRTNPVAIPGSELHARLKLLRDEA